MRLLVTLCTYNERDNFPELTTRILRAAPSANVLIVDDASPDGTGELADELARDDSRIHVLHRPGKLGLGSATIAAFRWGIAEDYDRLLNMDADLSHPPEAIPRLLAQADRADVIIGSRYIPGGSITDWPLSRHVMSRGVNILTRSLLGVTPRDCSGAFRLYSVELLRRIDFEGFVSAGYAFQEEMLYRCRRAGASFHEVPIHFQERITGRSKANTREIVIALRDLALLGRENLLGSTRAGTQPTQSAPLTPADQTRSETASH